MKAEWFRPERMKTSHAFPDGAFVSLCSRVYWKEAQDSPDTRAKKCQVCSGVIERAAQKGAQHGRNPKVTTTATARLAGRDGVVRLRHGEREVRISSRASESGKLKP